MTTYTFPGHVVFLEAAAHQLGCPEAVGPARRIETLSAMTNLCAQASLAELAHAPAILAKAEEFRDQLHVAYTAANLMLTELSNKLAIDTRTNETLLAAQPTHKAHCARRRNRTN